AAHPETFVRHRGPVTCAAPVPGSARVVTSGYDGAVGLWDLATHQARLLGYHDHLVNRIAVHPQGRSAASVSSDYTVRLWDLSGEAQAGSLAGHEDDVEDFTFVEDRYGASASRDHKIVLWDLATRSVLRVLAGHDKDVLSLTYAEGRLYSSGDDMTLRVWDGGTG